jgi:hypothetical protein
MSRIQIRKIKAQSNQGSLNTLRASHCQYIVGSGPFFAIPLTFSGAAVGSTAGLVAEKAGSPDWAVVTVSLTGAVAGGVVGGLIGNAIPGP